MYHQRSNAAEACNHHFTLSKLDRLIGHHIADEQVTDILRRLGCEVTEGKDEWQAVAPSWRFDMEIEEDLVEEVAGVFTATTTSRMSRQQASLIMGTDREADLSLKRVNAAQRQRLSGSDHLQLR